MFTSKKLIVVTLIILSIGMIGASVFISTLLQNNQAPENTFAAGSCKIGVNFANFAAISPSEINKAIGIGYGYGQLIIQGPESVTNQSVISQFNSMCSGGITPVVRSCVGDRCQFSSGTEHGEVLASLSKAISCGATAYYSCGHNEPIAEYPLGMAAEGSWSKDCAAAFESNGGRGNLMSPIFNGTYDDGNKTFIQNIGSFIDGFGGASAVNEAFVCTAINVYDSGGSSTAVSYLDRLSSSSLGLSLPYCVNETGVLGSGGISSEQNSAVAVDLQGKENVIFALGFNWTGTNPGWSAFTPTDCGKLALKDACGIPISNTACGEFVADEVAVCGNGVIDEGGGITPEACDEGDLNGFVCEAELSSTCTYCNSTCTGVIEVKGREPVCGDGIVEGVNEECDDGNLENLDSCNSNCRIESVGSICGNGVTEVGEECGEPGLSCSGSGTCNQCQCSVVTVQSVCGDGVVDFGEQCDDGNNLSADGCSSICALETIPDTGLFDEDSKFLLVGLLLVLVAIVINRWQPGAERIDRFLFAPFQWMGIEMDLDYESRVEEWTKKKGRNK